MPQAVYDIPDVRESMLRPAVLDIARQVLEWTGLPRTTKLMYAGENTEVFQPGSTISNEPTFNQFDSDARWTINVEERTAQDLVLTGAADYMDHPPIFNDPDSGYIVRPAYVEVDLVFNFVSKFADRNSARMWRNDLRSRAAMNREARYHSVAYSYLFPEECIDIAIMVNEKREKVAPYGENLDQYWNRYVTPKATVLSDNIGKNTRWAVAETQGELIGYFDFPDEPEEGSKHAENSSWDIDFTYTVKVHVPVATWMRYPLVIHNQVVPKNFRPSKRPPRPEDKKIQYSMVAEALNNFVKQNLAVKRGTPGMCIPEYDEFIPESRTIPPDTLRVVTWLTAIDPTNPLELMKIDDDALSADQHFDAPVLEFMRSESQWITKYRQSIFNIVVFKNNGTMPIDSYYVTPDLKVMLVDQPDLRAQYHVRLSLYQRPRLLPPEAKLRLRNHCTAAVTLLTTLNPNVVNLSPSCMIQDFMADNVYTRLVEEVDREFDSRWDKTYIQFNTVMTYVINARRNN